ncbi:MAG TPA: hypothetical protein VKB03_04045 [Conexibacter sp.]|nr:hypothetical protein [Conexibacter sp.]
MRRSWLLIALGLAGLAAGGWILFRALTHEASEPASVTAAIARFQSLPRAARTLPQALRGRAPEPGVYVYGTRGFEVSHVLGTRRHPYAADTAITVTIAPHHCLRSRWDTLATRHDAILACPRSDGGWRLIDQSEEHEFAGHVDRRTYACTLSSTYRPARPATGTRWTSRCAIDGTTTADTSMVLGPRTLTLAGRRTRTLLIRTTTSVSGDTTGAGTAFTWVLPGTGLMVRRTIANANTTGTIVGDVRYEERAALALSQLRPHR